MQPSTLKHKLFTEVSEVTELLVILLIVVEVCDNAPAVKGDCFSTEVLILLSVTHSEGADEPGGRRGDGEAGVTGGHVDICDVFLFMYTQFASEAGSLCVISFVQGVDECSWEFEPIMNRDEELGDLAVVGYETLGEVLSTNGVEGVVLNESLDLILQIADLSVVGSTLAFQHANESRDDKPKFQ